MWFRLRGNVIYIPIIPTYNVINNNINTSKWLMCYKKKLKVLAALSLDLKNTKNSDLTLQNVNNQRDRKSSRLIRANIDWRLMKQSRSCYNPVKLSLYSCCYSANTVNSSPPSPPCLHTLLHLFSILPSLCTVESRYLKSLHLRHCARLPFSYADVSCLAATDNDWQCVII